MQLHINYTLPGPASIFNDVGDRIDEIVDGMDLDDFNECYNATMGIHYQYSRMFAGLLILLANRDDIDGVELVNKFKELHQRHVHEIEAFLGSEFHDIARSIKNAQNEDCN